MAVRSLSFLYPSAPSSSVLIFLLWSLLLVLDRNVLAKQEDSYVLSNENNNQDSSLSSLSLSSSSSIVEVYDNVLSPTTSKWLHTIVEQWPNKNVVFLFPLQDPKRFGPIEQSLNQILLELYPQNDNNNNNTVNEGNNNNNNNDNTNKKYFVEFWKRTPWRHISAHADMDEGYGMMHQHLKFRHPEIGHVLYLDIGSKVQGPTIVWNVSNAKQMYQQSTSEMIIVPAVQGRLLRFIGTSLHAVPRPADLYWTHQLGDKQDGPEFQRSVLLFNIWPVEEIDGGAGRPPLDYEILNGTQVETETETETETQSTEGQEENENHDNEKTTTSRSTDSSSSSSLLQLLSNDQSCHPKSEWIPVPVIQYHEEPTSPPSSLSLASSLSSWFWSFLGFTSNTSRRATFQVPLMGGQERRGIEGYVAKLEAPIETPTLFQESKQVTSIHVYTPKHLLLPPPPPPLPKKSQQPLQSSSSSSGSSDQQENQSEL